MYNHQHSLVDIYKKNERDNRPDWVWVGKRGPFSIDAHPTKLSRSFSSIDPPPPPRRIRGKKKEKVTLGRLLCVVFLSLRGIFFISSSCFLSPLSSSVRVHIAHTILNETSKRTFFFSFSFSDSSCVRVCVILPTIHQGLYYFLPTFSHNNNNTVGVDHKDDDDGGEGFCCMRWWCEEFLLKSQMIRPPPGCC